MFSISIADYIFPSGCDTRHIAQLTGLVAADRLGQPVNSEVVVSAGCGKITEQLSHIYPAHGQQKTENIVAAMQRDLQGIKKEERVYQDKDPLKDMLLKSQRVFSKNFITGTDSLSDFYGYATSYGTVGLILKSINVEWKVQSLSCTSLALMGSKGSLRILSSSLDGSVCKTDFGGGQYWPIYQGKSCVTQVILYGDNCALAAVGKEVLTLDLRSKSPPSILNTGMPCLGVTWHSLNARTVATCGLGGGKVFDMRWSSRPLHCVPGSYFSCQLSPFLAQV